jgi:hypothetical protein
MSISATSRRAGREAYIEGTLNELAADRYYMTEFELGSLFDFVLTRVPRCHSFARRYPLLFTILIRAISLLWWVPIFPLLIALSVLRFGLQKVRCRHRQSLQGDVVVGTAHKVAGILSRISDHTVQYWLQVPWIRLEGIPPRAQIINLLGLITWGDLIAAAFDAWDAARAVSRRFPNWTDRLQTYTAYPCFIFWRALIRHSESPSTLWFANHFDRWAVLLDRLPTGAQRVLIQHGTHAMDEFPVPSRLTNIKLFYCVSSREAEFFKRNVFEPSAQPEFRFLSSTLTLVRLPWLDSSCPSILMIGHPHTPEKELDILRKLSQVMPHAELILKPHPIYGVGIYKGVHALSIHILREKDTFPRVDLAICDVSTLGLEYEASGIPVVWHKDLDVDKTVEEVRTYFAGRKQI